jgi:23S rRNA (pseudouridine1915-N3)-methyltransferase
MQIHVYIIDKKAKREIYDPLIEHYIKSSKKWADVTVHEVFSKEISKANEISPDAARMSYSVAYEKYSTNGYSVALDPSAKEVDSHEFSELLKDRGVVNFFIGGAYGFERGFVDKSDNAVSFGKITLSHKLIKVVLLEQIFRGLSILHNHPYHK